MTIRFVAKRIDGGLEGCGPSQALCTDINTNFAAPTERTSSRDRPAIEAVP
jgi:hypothetical protein